jgi:tetratricopeptide (TPR) repeat protein
MGQTDVAQTLREASEQIAFFNWDRAGRLYRAAMSDTEEGSAQWQEAAYGTAVAAQHVSPADPAKIDEAAKLYQALSKPELGSRFAARSLMNLGRIAELRDYYGDVPDLNTARKYYATVTERFPNEEIAAEATLRLASAYVQSYKPDDVKAGVDVLERYLSAYPDGPLASGMWQYLGDTYFYPLADFSKSLKAYVNADRLGWLDDSDIGRVWWRVAQLGERVGDVPTAIRFYTRIVTEAAVSGKAYESQMALKRLGAPVPKIRLGTAGSAEPAPATQPTTVPMSAPPGTRPVETPIPNLGGTTNG